MTRVVVSVLALVLVVGGSAPAWWRVPTDPGGGPTPADQLSDQPQFSQPQFSQPQFGQPQFSWPVPGSPEVLRAFDTPVHRFAAGHRGVDLAGAAGTPVLAAGAGTVVFAGPVAGRTVVSIDHPGGLRTTYEPVDPLVRAGDAVAAGERIGTMLPGHAGCAPEVCLHWGVRRGVDYLDPLRLLGLGTVRLLPWHDARPAPPGAGRG